MRQSPPPNPWNMNVKTQQTQQHDVASCDGGKQTNHDEMASWKYQWSRPAEWWTGVATAHRESTKYGSSNFVPAYVGDDKKLKARGSLSPRCFRIGCPEPGTRPIKLASG